MSARALGLGILSGLLLAGGFTSIETDLASPARPLTARFAAGDRPAVGGPERVRVPATIVVDRRHAELVRHVLLTDPRNRVAALRVCKLGHTDRAHCTLVPVGDVRYGGQP